MLSVVGRRARRHAPTLALLFASLLAFVAAARAQQLSIAVSGLPLSLPIFVAEAEGDFQAEGLAVRLVDCIGGARCFRQMLVVEDNGSGFASAIASRLLTPRGADLHASEDLGGPA